MIPITKPNDPERARSARPRRTLLACRNGSPAVAFLLLCTVLLVNRAELAGGSGLGGRRPDVMSGHYTATAITLFLDRELVRSWLPSGLKLADQTPFEKQPVIILFGTQRDLAHEGLVTVKPRWARSGRCFLEAFVGIPYVQMEQDGCQTPLLHFVRVYVNSPQAASHGIKRSGWPKILASIDDDGETYRIHYGSWGTVFEARTDRGNLRPVDPENDSLRRLEAMLSQPLVLVHDGRFELHRFDFHFECAGVWAVSSEVNLSEGFMPGLEPMQITSPGMDKSELGAIMLDCRYTRTPM